MSEKTRHRIVLAILTVVTAPVVWSAWVTAFASTQWFYGHWQLICLVMGVVGVLGIAGIALLFRVHDNPTIKTIAACAVIAAAIAAPAKAGDPQQYEDYAAYNVAAKFWNWLRTTVGSGDIWQAMSTMNQPTGQAIANDFSANAAQPVPAPSGPATPTLMEQKQK